MLLENKNGIKGTWKFLNEVIANNKTSNNNNIIIINNNNKKYT